MTSFIDDLNGVVDCARGVHEWTPPPSTGEPIVTFARRAGRFTQFLEPLGPCQRCGIAPNGDKLRTHPDLRSAYSPVHWEETY